MATTYRRMRGPDEFMASICSFRRLARAIALSMSWPRSRASGSLFASSRLSPSARVRSVLSNLAVELRHNPIEFVEPAAQPLTVLLREFGPLRADQSGQQGDRQSKSTCKHTSV